MTENIYFYSGDLKLEGMLDRCRGGHAAVVAHPHPLYGGDMHNTVVDRIARTCRELGITTLRFNFRGTGNSQGRYDDGEGEQEDVRAAVAYLRDAGMERITLAGYSFGAWVIARALQKSPLADNVIMVSPPVAFIDFADIGRIPRLKGVITGSLDDIAPAGMIMSILPGWHDSADFSVITGADHFFSGHAHELASALRRLL